LEEEGGEGGGGGRGEGGEREGRGRGEGGEREGRGKGNTYIRTYIHMRCITYNAYYVCRLYVVHLV
jgi:hypothetical protein